VADPEKEQEEEELYPEEEDTQAGQTKTNFFERFPALARLSLGGRHRRIPVVQQLTMVECGAACLAMVLGFFGKAVRLEEVREVVGVDRDGSTALGILNAARYYGLRGRGVKIEIEDLEYLDEGSILHWEFNHFVVFEKLRTDSVDIVDPGFGRRRVLMDQFRKSFTGVALLLEPGDNFEEKKEDDKPVWRYLRSILRQSGQWSRVVVTSLLLQLFALAIPILTGSLVDRVVPRGDYHLLTVLSIGLFSIVGFNFLATMVRSHLLLHLRTALDARMTLGFLDHLVALPYAFFQRRSAGDLMMRLNSNATIREILTSSALSGLLDGALVTIYLVILLVVSPLMGGVTLGLGIAQALTFVFTRRKTKDLMSQNLSIQAKSESYQVEMLAGIESLKAMGAEQRAVEHWSDLFVNTLNVSLDRGRLAAWVDSVTGTLRLASPLIIMVVGAMLVLNGTLSLGTMLGLNALAGGFLTPLGNLVTTAGQFQLLGSYIERLDDVFNTQPEQDRHKVRSAPQLSGCIDLEHVSFRYGPLAPVVVKDVSLHIEPGQFVALVGKSGSGKSTLASLLLGLYQPTQGRILFDNFDMAELEIRSVRRQLGIVTQRPYLFGTSIRANIALSDPSLNLEAVVDAARTAQMHDEILEMGMGYESLLTDGGASLSGGQRQRIALARALVRKPAVLLLDEATSALDAITEQKVQNALSELHCTRVVIAHRLSTVVKADLILVMDDGQIVEQGTHEELLRAGGFYAKLVAAQLANEKKS
jgi:ABC-type bacteriocin/lantibiotic exporter with double-glycine peptidase domain